MSKKHILLSIKFAITIVLVYFLIQNIDWGEVVSIIARVNVWIICLYILFLGFGIVISSRKWMVLSRAKGFSYSEKDHLIWYLTGMFLNNFFPSFIGGDFYRTYQLGKGKRDYKGASSTVVLDRLTGLISILLLSFLLLFIEAKSIFSEPVMGFAALGLFLGIVFVGVIIYVMAYTTIISKLPRFISKYVTVFNSFNKTTIVRSFEYSFLFTAVGIGLANYVLFLAVGVTLDFFSFLSVIFLMSVISSLPISIGNIGVKEWAYVVFFGLFGVSSAIAVTVVLLSRIITMLVSLIALPFYLKQRTR